ncbi:MAG TPA: hypothetical protein VGE34_04600 [Candidatus Saccharimonadales bacterium]
MTKKTKLLLIGGIAGFILLFGVILLTLWLTLWMPPSKEDFTDAKKTAEKIVSYEGLKQVNAFITATNAQSKAGKTGQALIDSVKTEREKALEAVDNRSNLADELSKSKVLRDADVKKLFDVYFPIEDRYGKYITNYVNEYPVYLTSSVSCVKPFNLGAAGKTIKQLAELHETYGKTCLADLAKLEKSPIPAYVKYAKEFKAVINERQKALDGVATGSMTDAAAAKHINTTNARYLTIWPTDEMKKYRKSQTFSGELKKLIEVLGQKAQ